jgi:competence protein ComEC
MRRPVVWLAVCLVTGYAAASRFASFLPLRILILGAACAAVAWIFRVPGRMWAGCALCVFLSAGYYEWVDRNNVSALLSPGMEAEALDEQEISIQGVIASPVEVDGDRVMFVVKARKLTLADGRTRQLKERMQFSIRLLTKAEQEYAEAWQRGDMLSVRSAVLRVPAEARNFGGFDYRRYLSLKHIHWLVAVKGTEQVKVTPPADWNPGLLLRWNDRLRILAGNRIDQLFPGDQGGFMKSLLLGLRDDLDPESFRQFSQLGLTHILAISGLHVGIFAGGCLLVLKWLGRTREASLAVAILLQPVYILLTGASPSVVRAGLMAMIGLYAARRNLLKDGLNLACAVGVAMLLWNPYYLYDVSFQLSFLVTIGLIVFVPGLSRMLPVSSQRLSSAVSVMLVSQAVSFPLSIYYFSQFSLLSWAANLVIVPLFSLLVIPLGSAALLLGSFLPAAGKLTAWPVFQLNRIIFWSVDKISGWEKFQTIWPTPSIGWILLYYGTLAAIFRLSVYLAKRRTGEDVPGNYLPKQTLSEEFIPAGVREEPAGGAIVYRVELDGPGRDPKTVAAVLVLAALGFAALLFHGYTPDRWNREGLVSVLDVGQGDAILIRTPDNRHFLIDGGGTLRFRKQGEEWKERRDPYEVGQKLLVPLLKQRGVHALDGVVLTHEDMDHYGGLQAVVEQIPVRSFWFNGTYKPSESLHKLFKTVLDKKIPLIKAGEGKRLTLDKWTKLTFIYPEPAGEEKVTVAKRQNDDTVVFLLQMYGSRFLFTGDMEKEAEAIVLDRLETVETVPGKMTPIDVLKVAHHGSKTSTTPEWLNYWKPKYAVISVGESNPYGHPDDGVIQRLAERGIGIRRTDLDGEVRYRVTSSGLRVEWKLRNNGQTDG